MALRLPVFAARERVEDVELDVRARRHGYADKNLDWKRARDCVVAADPDGICELFLASDSSRWTSRSLSEGRFNLADEPSWEVALKVAALWRSAHVPENAAGRAVRDVVPAYAYVARRVPHGSARMRRVLAQVVTRYQIRGIDLVGPGAKTVVSVDCSGRAVQAYHFWHDVFDDATVEVAILGEEQALKQSGDRYAATLDREVAPRRVYYLPPPGVRAAIVMPFYLWERLPARSGDPQQERRAARALVPAIAMEDVPDYLRARAERLYQTVRTLI